MRTLLCVELLNDRLLVLVLPTEVDPVQVSQQLLVLGL